jgi:hypothetical protein
MQQFFTNLLTGLTTVFAWTPASILLIMPFIGMYTGLVYLQQMSALRLLALAILCIGGVLGYLGLTSVCWGLKLKLNTKRLFLIIGTLTLASVMAIGNFSENTLLHTTLSIEHFYLFMCPLFFLFLHSVLAFKR